jgi:hypothetical protein
MTITAFALVMNVITAPVLATHAAVILVKMVVPVLLIRLINMDILAIVHLDSTVITVS